MRSILLALALAAPLSAVAAPTYSDPLNAMHHQKQQEVALTFVNYTSQERELRIGNYQYAMRSVTVFHTLVPVGSVIRMYSNENSKLNGQELMQVSASDANTTVRLK